MAFCLMLHLWLPCGAKFYSSTEAQYREITYTLQQYFAWPKLRLCAFDMTTQLKLCGIENPRALFMSISLK